MNKRKRVGESTEQYGTQLFIVIGVKQWPSTTAEMEQLERKLEMKERRERYNSWGGSLESKNLCQTLPKAFDMSKSTVEVSPKLLKEDDQELERKARRSPVEQPLRNPYRRSDRRLEADRSLWIFLLRIVSKALERQASKSIGR